jgi:hypothetical protein
VLLNDFSAQGHEPELEAGKTRSRVPEEIVPKAMRITYAWKSKLYNTMVRLFWESNGE